MDSSCRRSDFLEKPRWIARYDGIIVHIFCDYTARSNNTAVPNVYARQDSNVSSYPAIVSDLSSASHIKRRIQ
jgi:hypothetical protein